VLQELSRYDTGVDEGGNAINLCYKPVTRSAKRGFVLHLSMAANLMRPLNLMALHHMDWVGWAYSSCLMREGGFAALAISYRVPCFRSRMMTVSNFNCPLLLHPR
jgi:hypothetical protein